MWIITAPSSFESESLLNYVLQLVRKFSNETQPQSWRRGHVLTTEIPVQGVT